jgi:hypothetical protein
MRCRKIIGQHYNQRSFSLRNIGFLCEGGETEVKEIRTQGLQNGNNSAWVTEFFLDFRRSDNSVWEDYMENNSVRVS